MRAQIVGIADLRQNQQLRRVDDAAGEDHLALGMSRDAFAAFEVFDPDRSPLVEHDPGGDRIGLNGECRARQRRSQVSDSRTAPPAVADRRLPAGNAFLLRAVVIVGGGMPGGDPGRHECVRQ